MGPTAVPPTPTPETPTVLHPPVLTRISAESPFASAGVVYLPHVVTVNDAQTITATMTVYDKGESYIPVDESYAHSSLSWEADGSGTWTTSPGPDCLGFRYAEFEHFPYPTGYVQARVNYSYTLKDGSTGSFGSGLITITYGSLIKWDDCEVDPAGDFFVNAWFPLDPIVENGVVTPSLMAYDSNGQPVYPDVEQFGVVSIDNVPGVIYRARFPEAGTYSFDLRVVYSDSTINNWEDTYHGEFDLY